MSVSNGFGVDTDGLIGAVPQITNLAEQVGEVYEALNARLAELGAPWGDDATGHAIAANYLPAAELTLDGARSMRVALVNTGGGLTIMANGLRDTELENWGSISRGDGPLA
jgi:hypothetical protein